MPDDDGHEYPGRKRALAPLIREAPPPAKGGRGVFPTRRVIRICSTVSGESAASACLAYRRETRPCHFRAIGRHVGKAVDWLIGRGALTCLAFRRETPLLATIDPGDYDVALDNARAQAVAVRATIQQPQAHVDTLVASEEGDKATAAADRASAVNAANPVKAKSGTLCSAGSRPSRFRHRLVTTIIFLYQRAK